MTAGRLYAVRHGRTAANGNRYAMPGGESPHDVFGRVERLQEEIEPELRAERNVAVVGHFWSLRMLVGVLSAVPFDELFARSVAFAPENGSMWQVELTAEAAGPLRTTCMSPL